MPVRIWSRRWAVAALVLLIAASAVVPFPRAAADAPGRRPAGGGLSAVVRYTAYGIPHIVARDYPSLGFGTGWAQAQDAVCDLAEAFITVRGERSRHFGARGAPNPRASAATTNLASDLFYRGVRDTGTVERLMATPPPTGPSHRSAELRRGWAAGYNAWLRQERITDPACGKARWVRPVTAVDVAALEFSVGLFGGQALGIDGITAARPPGSTRTADAAQPTPDLTRTAEAAHQLLSPASELPGRDTSLASNAVAFHGSTTANGRGLLLGNPHFPWRGQLRFWQSQQTIPGELNVAGGSLLGSATVSIGYTADIAWSHTDATGIAMNLHQLTLDPADPTTYLVDGRPERMTRRTVTVPVDNGGEVTRAQWWTRYGPVLTSLPGGLTLPWTATSAYALSDPGAANLRGADTALGLAKARSTREILTALNRTQGLPWANTLAADSAGHTLFSQSQVLPRITDDLVRRCSTPLGHLTYPDSGLAVLDGARGDCVPGTDPDAVQPGTFGPAALPLLQDAPYVENSNDSAWLTNADRPLTGHPRIFGPTGTPRSLRTRGAIEDVSALAARGGLTVADLQRQQFSNRAPAGDLAAAETARACAALPGAVRTADVTAACRVLARWDRTMNPASRGALLFDRFWRRLLATVPPADLWTVPFSPADPVHTPRVLNTAAPGFSQALIDTVAELRSTGTALDARLGEHQFVTRGGQRIPVPGGTDALGVWNTIEPDWDPTVGAYPDVPYGTSYLQAVTWTNDHCPDARTLLTYSQSPNPRSPHTADQTRLFSTAHWVTPPFCEGEIRRAPGLRTVTVRE
ncbi:penicillin acylase family protein [Streptomyces sp. NPDC087425]|uniref:penicillin acylase family protein n=1 Tax=Streptomyces sp. NPDC087425 TaxID=3365787 RepID=UPI00380FB1F2